MIRFFLIAAVLFCSSVHANVYRTQYFADFHFWESPYQPFIGTMPLSEADAKNRAHIQVGYDRLNRIVDIQTRLGKAFKAIPTLYVHALHTKIDYRDDTEVHQFFDGFGNRISVWGEVWEKHYQKDQRGRYLALTFINKDNQPIENAWGIAAYRWTHEDSGTVIEERVDANGKIKTHRPGFEFERIRLVFDGRGNLRLMQNLDDNNELKASASGAAQYRYFYNTRQGFERWEVLDTEGKPALGPTGTAGEQYTFDEYNWTRIAFFGADGAPKMHASGAANWHAAYDQYGNMTSRWFTDAKLQPVNGQYGFHKRISIWDPSGMRLLRHEYYGKDGNLTRNSDGVAKVHYLYNDMGLLQEVRNTDEQDRLVNNDWSGYARQTFTYDNQRAQTSSQYFLADGQPYSTE
ncbi:hypothetical protein P2G88_16520 [Aliiglaciecola sp. CAU 1673]|uniref:hypothetical protein n=1 Tax=Aliiglaciecola sp. CAU 1673 TaxID=3032595 RepID=UPI0023DAF01B|nr:hypothetical protein [Aliiglaciecola sp. CAU 1673]MDF2179858.1 hypothetical protein [Aliiglaciecola sp. CAU 1673]